MAPRPVRLIKLRAGCLKSCMLRGQLFHPKNCIVATKDARCIFLAALTGLQYAGFRWFSPSFSTPTCVVVLVVLASKLGVRLTLVLPSRMPLASASAAVALIARELDGGSLSGSLGFCGRLRCLGGGSPTGSLGLCTRCPALALLSEGLPAGPHGHCVSLASSCSCSSGVSSVGSTLLSSSPPQSGGVTSGELASLFTLGSEVSPVVPLFAVGLSVRRRAPS